MVIRFKHAVLATAVLSTLAQAEPALSPIVVTATRQSQPINESIATVTVINKEEIEKSGPSNTLGEILGRVPGVELARAGGRGADETVYIRGANSGHTLVLVDGIRLGSATLGSTSLQMIPVNQIERIEVLRGPASALYGSDAIGGVIQVFTKPSNNAPTLSATMGAGNQGTYETSVAHANKIGGLSYSIQAGKSGTKGINSIITPTYPAFNPDKDGYDNKNFNLNASYKFDGNLEIGGGFLNSYSKNKYDAYQAEYLLAPPWYRAVNADWNYQATHENTSANIFAKLPLNANWNATLRAAQGVDRQEQPGAVVGDPNSIFKTVQDQFSWQNDIHLPVGDALVLFERLEQKVESTSSYSQKSRTIDSITAGWHGQFGSHGLQANIRNDRNSQFGNHETYFLGYSHQLSSVWSLAASYGTAFKAPTINDLYYPITPGAGGGNANLKPEKSNNQELSLRYATESTQGSATYFENKIKNLIEWRDTDPSPVLDFYEPINISQVNIKGFEFTAKTTVGAWTFSSDLTFQNPRDEATGEQLIRRAKQLGTLSAVYSLNSINVGIELKGVGRRLDSPHWLTHLHQVEMGGYSLVNLFADYRLNRSWKIFARIDNFFDRKYEMARSTETTYGVPGLTIFTGIRLTLD